MLIRTEYIVKDISGDYAILVNNNGYNIENPVALFFLPDDISVGCKIIYENLEYTVEK